MANILLLTLALFALSALLTFGLARCLKARLDNMGKRYRLSVLAGCLLSLAAWAYMYLSGSASAAFLAFAGGLAGAFCGGLWITAAKMALWENNSPPSQSVRQAVYRQHVAVIGQPPRTPPAKRCFDIFLAAIGLLLSSPVWLLSMLCIWLEDPGPILFVKNSVGKSGVNFHQYKFRTMEREAEQTTGPVLASQEDERVLAVGRLLRKTALDELPQLINILKGEMSFVGPRPQRTVLVQDYLEHLPAYARRHSVLPGLAGLAQVVGTYYLTPRQKLRFDLLYIEHASLGFDIKLIVLAFLIAFWYRWQKGWNGRLPRRLVRSGARFPF